MNNKDILSKAYSFTAIDANTDGKTTEEIMADFTISLIGTRSCTKCSKLLGDQEIASDLTDALNTASDQSRVIAVLTERIKRLQAELDYCVKNTNWECSYCHFHHQHRDCVYDLFLGDKNHIWDVIATDESERIQEDK